MRKSNSDTSTITVGYNGLTRHITSAKPNLVDAKVQCQGRAFFHQVREEPRVEREDPVRCQGDTKGGEDLLGLSGDKRRGIQSDLKTPGEQDTPVDYLDI